MKQRVVEVHPYFGQHIQVACVKTGICCFPNYTDCPVQEHTIKVTDEQKGKIECAWITTDHVANPIAKNGKTM